MSIPFEFLSNKQIFISNTSLMFRFQTIALKTFPQAKEKAILDHLIPFCNALDSGMFEGPELKFTQPPENHQQGAAAPGNPYVQTYEPPHGNPYVQSYELGAKGMGSIPSSAGGAAIPGGARADGAGSGTPFVDSANNRGVAPSPSSAGGAVVPGGACAAGAGAGMTSVGSANKRPFRESIGEDSAARVEELVRDQMMTLTEALSQAESELAEKKRKLSEEETAKKLAEAKAELEAAKVDMQKVIAKIQNVINKLS